MRLSDPVSAARTLKGGEYSQRLWAAVPAKPRRTGRAPRNERGALVSTNSYTPVEGPTVIRLHGETYVSARELLAIARRTGLAASTVVRVLVAQVNR